MMKKFTLRQALGACCALVTLLATGSAVGAPYTAYTSDPAFTGGRGGSGPTSPPIIARDGNLYGTTANGLGTVYRTTPDGTTTTIHVFSSTDGNGFEPHAALVQARDGSLWGTTRWGGAVGRGTVFRIDSDGSNFSTVHSFNGSVDGGEIPLAPLLLARDGNFYGTTSQGSGNIYRLTPKGAYTNIAQFRPDQGTQPLAGLVQTPDGSLWGTTSSGGSASMGCGAGCGSVFRLAPDNTLTAMVLFDGSSGIQPDSPLILGTDGLLYGVTPRCFTGGHCHGNAFSVTQDGKLTVLHEFTDTEIAGSLPSGRLLQAKDGTFYGVNSTNPDVASNMARGTVWRMTAKGKVTLIHDFDADPAFEAGFTPIGGLVDDRANHRFAGVTNGGGVGFNGTLFFLAPAPSAAEQARGTGE